MWRKYCSHKWKFLPLFSLNAVWYSYKILPMTNWISQILFLHTFFTFSRRCCPKRLTVIHTYADGGGCHARCRPAHQWDVGCTPEPQPPYSLSAGTHWWVYEQWATNSACMFTFGLIWTLSGDHFYIAPYCFSEWNMFCSAWYGVTQRPIKQFTTSCVQNLLNKSVLFSSPHLCGGFGVVVKDCWCATCWEKHMQIKINSFTCKM